MRFLISLLFVFASQSVLAESADRWCDGQFARHSLAKGEIKSMNITHVQKGILLAMELQTIAGVRAMCNDNQREIREFCAADRSIVNADAAKMETSENLTEDQKNRIAEMNAQTNQIVELVINEMCN